MRMPGFTDAGGGETRASEAAKLCQHRRKGLRNTAPPTNAIAACKIGSFFHGLWGSFGLDC